MTGTPARPKWGILGSGKICQDWTSALKLNGSSVVAVAARSLESAKAFAERFEIPRSYGSYSSLLEDEEVQIVYVGTIHTHHCALVLEALEKGKHVLCEKPMGMNSGEVKRMVDLAESKGLFLMENMWTRSFPATRKVADIIASGSLGAVVTCTADLGFVIPEEVERLYNLDLGGGGLLDLGIYPLAWVLLAFQSQKVESVGATGSIHRAGADTTGIVTLKYANGGIGSAMYSCMTNTQKEVHICLERGSIHVHNCTSMHTPEKVVIRSTKGEEILDFPLPPAGKAKMNFSNSEGFVYAAQHVEECLSASLCESPNWTLAETVECTRIMDQARKILGVKYPQD